MSRVRIVLGVPKLFHGEISSAVESQVVILVVTGSIPVSHPIFLIEAQMAKLVDAQP